MQCPSCGFENMPGRTDCAVCSTALSSAPKRESVLPPRAKDRTLRQNLEWQAANLPGLGAISHRIENFHRNVRIVIERHRRPWAWLVPRTVGLMLLSGIPGFDRFFIMRQRLGGLLVFIVAAVTLALAVIMYRSPISDVFLLCVLIFSMISMGIAAERMRGRSNAPGGHFTSYLGIGLMVLAVYTGSYMFLRLALSPVVRVVRVVVQPNGSVIQRGDSLLLWRRDSLKRGDMVIGTVLWQGQPITTAGPLVGVPGDKLSISDKLYVNGVPTRLPGLIGLHGEAMAGYSSSQTVTLTLGQDEYWFLPNFNQAPDAQAVLDTGIVQKSDIWGRVVAITAPAEHRGIVSRTEAVEVAE